MSPMASWTLEHFHPWVWRVGEAGYLACRHCFRAAPSTPPPVHSKGIVKYIFPRTGKSPSGLVRHCESHGLRRKKRSDAGIQGDRQTTRDFVRNVIVLDLLPFRVASRRGTREFFRLHLKAPVYSRHHLRKMFHTFPRRS